MSELRQEQEHVRTKAKGEEKTLAVRTSPTEVRYLTLDELDKSISQEDIQRGLDLAGSWSDLNLSEQEVFESLKKIRYGSEHTPSIRSE